MTDVKRCPCGEVPEQLDVEDNGQVGTYALAVPSCCSVWKVEFMTHHRGIPEQFVLAREAWNEAPRAKDNG